jgi:hypothetical protein
MQNQDEKCSIWKWGQYLLQSIRYLSEDNKVELVQEQQK